MTGLLVTGIWFLNRGTALVTMPALWLAVLSGVFVRTGRPVVLHDLSNEFHTRIAVFALVITAMHATIGTVDALLLGVGLAPAPGYPGWFFVAGLVLGVLALAAIVVATLSFLAPWRFRNPSLVHALAYVGFAFGVVHAIAIGTDIVGFAEGLLQLGLFIVAAALLLKLFVGLGAGIRQVVSS